VTDFAIRYPTEVFLTMIGNGFDLLGTTPQWQYVLQGVILAAAVSLDAWSRRKRA